MFPVSNKVARNAGITGQYNDNPLAIKIITAFFAGLAMYNALELMTAVFVTFRRYRGLYFWSLLVASFGIIPCSLGLTIKFFGLTGNNQSISEALNLTGWCAMVTGQSVVLWSRLHLILTGPNGARVLAWTKWMIITDAIIFHIPISVLNAGCNGVFGPNLAPYVQGFNVYEKVQMTGFCIQETILSSIYIIETVRILRTSLRPNTRKVLYQLVSINVIIIILDLALLSCEFADLYIIESTFKGVVYSIKLKLEFVVLGQLVQFATWTQGESGRPSSCHDVETPKSVVMPTWGLQDLGKLAPSTTTCIADVTPSDQAVKPFDHVEVVATSVPSCESDAEARLYKHYEERSMSV